MLCTHPSMQVYQAPFYMDVHEVELEQAMFLPTRHPATPHASPPFTRSYAGVDMSSHSSSQMRLVSHIPGSLQASIEEGKVRQRMEPLRSISGHRESPLQRRTDEGNGWFLVALYRVCFGKSNASDER